MCISINYYLVPYRDVEITKRSAQSGEPPWDTLKGVVIVNVPVHYALAYGFSLQYRGEWDDLFARGIDTSLIYGNLPPVDNCIFLFTRRDSQRIQPTNKGIEVSLYTLLS